MLGVAFAQAADSAAGAAGQSPQGNPLMQMLPMLAVMGVIFYLFMIRPQQKRDKERRDMLAAMAKGDKVVTSGGMCGTIVGLREKTVTLRVSDDPVVKMDFLRGAIVQVTAKDKAKDDE